MRKFIAAILVCLFAMVSNAIGSEEHGALPSQQEFRMDGANIKLSIVPATFVSGKTPEIVLEVTDVMSRTPILDAGVYVLIQKTGGRPSQAGHSMNSMVKNSTASSEGLDFGETVQADMTTDLSMFRKAEPQQKAGVYSAAYPIKEKGDYTYTIAVTFLNGKKFKEPLIYGGSLAYHEASKASFYRMVTVMSLIFLCGIVAIWIIAQRRAAKISAGQKLNLLDIPWVKKFLRSAWFQPSFQLPVLLVFILIIIVGLFDIQQGDRNSSFSL